MSDRVSEFRRLYRDLRIADQANFYETRAAEYRRAHGQAITARNVLLVVSAVVGVLSQFTTGPYRGGMGVLAAALAALAGVVTAFETLIGFPVLEKIYTDTRLSLRKAEIGWLASTGDADLAEQVQRVELIFRTENGQWGQLALQSQNLPAAPGAVPAQADRPTS